MADPRNMDEELMMHLINTGTQVADDDGAKNNVQEDADDGSQYLALEQNEQKILAKYIFFIISYIYYHMSYVCS
jgi:hypothetical protein